MSAEKQEKVENTDEFSDLEEVERIKLNSILDRLDLSLNAFAL